MSIPPTGNGPADGAHRPRRSRRVRRHTPARRFSGVGRHSLGDTETVLLALEAETRDHGVEANPFSEQAYPATEALAAVSPGVAGPDEFDEVPAQEPVPSQAATAAPFVPEPPQGETPTTTMTDEGAPAWLAAAAEEASDAPRSKDTFSSALSRHGRSLPPGYLPAADFFSDKPADLEAVRKRRRRRRRNILVSLVVVLALIAGGIVALERTVLAPPADYAGDGSGSVTFTIEQGQTTSQVAQGLVDQDIVKSTKAFQDAMQRDDGTAVVLHPGDYPLKRQMSAQAAVKVLSDEDRQRVTFFSIASNQRLPDALDAIAEGTGVKRDELERLSKQPQEFGLPQADRTIEGYLHPGDYRFPAGSTPKEILTGLVDATKKTLTDTGVSDPAKQHEVLTIASIIAGEAPRKDYSYVAGIIDNRLNRDNKETHGYLQLDSTVAYGLDKTTVNLSKDELKDAKNPYNTYKHAGLPPTPIGSPGDAAIQAAAHPKANDDLYWVTVNLHTGEMKYAKTLKDHNKNVDQYRKWCSDNKDACS